MPSRHHLFLVRNDIIGSVKLKMKMVRRIVPPFAAVATDDEIFTVGAEELFE